MSSLNQYDDSNFGNKKPSWFHLESVQSNTKNSSQKQHRTRTKKKEANKSWTQKSLFWFFLCEMIIYCGSKISSIWFYTGKQRDIGIPVASWLTDGINFHVCISKKKCSLNKQKISSLYNLSLEIRSNRSKRKGESCDCQNQRRRRDCKYQW